MIFEPIPDRCVPEELPSLVKALPFISVLSPNAEEALSLLTISTPATVESVEAAAVRFLDIGVGSSGQGCVIIRSGALRAYVATKANGGRWVDAFESASKVTLSIQAQVIVFWEDLRLDCCSPGVISTRVSWLAPREVCLIS